MSPDYPSQTTPNTYKQLSLFDIEEEKPAIKQGAVRRTETCIWCGQEVVRDKIEDHEEDCSS